MSDSIRDYLYLDIDRVRSIYAQASGGLTESVRELQQEFDSILEEHESKTENLSKNIMLGSGRVATLVLHDYLFSSVEQRLGARIIHVSRENIQELSTGSLFRVSGRAEIDDVERMLNIMDNYNDMYKYLLTVKHASEIQSQIYDILDVIASLDETVPGSNARNATKRKKEAEKLLADLEPENITTRKLREQRGGISPIISETFKRMYGLFYKDIFEIKIVASFDDCTVFRGIINKEHLREDPSRIYAKYGSRPSVDWTMVGQVTSLKTPLNGEDKEYKQTNPDSTDDDPEVQREPDLRDAFENVYATIANTEEILIGPGRRNTWIATPLAIYHEVN